MTTNLYKSGNNWIFDSKITPTGTIKIDISRAPVVSFYYVSNGANVFDRAFNVSDILDANDTPYADFNTFIAAVSDFFVKASGGGGIDETYAKKTTQITHITIASGSWALSSGLYEASYSNVAITASNYVDVIPENSTIDIVKAAELLPKTVSSAGIVKLYAKNAPTGDITLTINIYE